MSFLDMSVERRLSFLFSAWATTSMYVGPLIDSFLASKCWTQVVNTVNFSNHSGGYDDLYSMLTSQQSITRLPQVWWDQGNSPGIDRYLYGFGVERTFEANESFD